MKITFCTILRYHSSCHKKTVPQHIHESVENYFYFYKTITYVFTNQQENFTFRAIDAIERNEISVIQYPLAAIKTISYLTVIIPLIMLIAKVAFRSIYPLSPSAYSTPIS